MSDSLVTVIMSVHNAEMYLRSSLESLLNQIYENLQIVIINDGSTDNSRNIITSYRDKRIEFIDRDENIGLTKSLNQGLAIAKGRYIARHDADDISISSRIAEQVAYMEADPNVDILGTGVDLFDGKNTLQRFIYHCPGNLYREQLLHYINPVPHPTLMFRSSILNLLKGYNEYFLLAQDYDFLLRASESFVIDSIPKSLVKLRFNPASLTYTDARQLKFGLAALICAHRRLKGYCDYSQESPDKWQIFLDQIDCFIKERHLDNRFIARKHLNSAKFSLLGMKLIKCMKDVLAAYQKDKTFFLYRGIGLHIPVDIEKFIVVSFS